MRTKVRRLLSVCITIAMLLTLALPSFASLDDVSGHWAESEINKWVEKGIVKGYGDGNFGPEDTITRAEFTALLARIFNFVKSSDKVFPDVSDTAWYADTVSKSVAADIIKGDDTGNFRPDDSISRQEAAVILYRVFDLKVKDEDAASSFVDYDSIPGWSKTAISALLENGYIKGRPDNTFAPTDNMNRAEAVKMIDSIAGDLKNVEGVYTGEIEGNLVVNTSDITLKDMNITGDLFLAHGIGEGEVTLSNVEVGGRVVVRGGGEDSIILDNTSIAGTLLVIKKDGKVRIVVKGDSEVPTVQVSSNAIILEEDLTGSGVGNIEVTELEAGDSIVLDGEFDSVDIAAPGVTVSFEGGSVENLNILESAVDSKVIIATATITKLNVDASAAVEGKGLIINANVTADGVTIEQNPTFLNIAEGVTAIIAGQPTTSDMPAPIIPSVPTGVPASFEAVNRFGIHEDKVYAGYSLKDKAGEQIALVASNIESMTVKNPDGTTATLTVGDDTDPLLWLNVEKAPGNYIFTVVTKAGVTYQATLTWTAPKVATWEATEREGEAPHDGKTYAEYKLMDGEDQISLKEGEVELIASKDANGKWVKLIPDTDATLWFKKAKASGNYEFIVVTTDNTIYKATLAYTLEVDEIATLKAVASAGVHVNKVYQGYELLDAKNVQIPLYENKIASISVLEPGATKAKALTVEGNDDPLLWFNVQKTPGEYQYIIETTGDDAKIYSATLTWTAPEKKEAIKSGEPAYNDDKKETYQLYTVPVDVSPEDTKVFQIKPDGTASELTVLADKDNRLNIWFRLSGGVGGPQQEGTHIFLIKKGDTWYEAVINYSATDDPMVTKALQAVNTAQITDRVEAYNLLMGEDGVAETLGLNVGEGSTFAGLVKGRAEAAAKDLFDNKPEGGYDLATIQAAFDENVATRMVFQESVAIFAAATTEDPLEDLEYITMLITNLKAVEHQTIHSGKSIEEVILPELEGLVDDFNALALEQQKTVLKEMDYSATTSSTATRNALRVAIDKVQKGAGEENNEGKN